VLSSGSWVVEKEIREIGLRTQTGASIVAIERNGATLINPDAFEKLLAGDQLLLLGSHDQVAAARKTLTAMPATAS
jgi:CPA2 family monovalent cation:H+ antiporter-2